MGSNSTAEIREYFLHDRALAAQLATLNLFPPWRDEISRLVNATTSGIGEPLFFLVSSHSYLLPDVETEAYKYFGDIIMSSAVVSSH